MNNVLETGQTPIMLFLPVELPPAMIAGLPGPPPRCKAAPTHDGNWLYFLKGESVLGRLVAVAAVLPDPNNGPIRLPTPAELAASLNSEGKIKVDIYVSGLFVNIIQVE